MNNAKTNTIVNKIINDTLSNKSHWRHFIEGHPDKIQNALLSQNLQQLNTFDSYWFENDKQFVCLLSTSDGKFSILLIDKRTTKSGTIFLPTESYFRLKSIIINQLGIAESLLDDFLKS